MFTLSDKLLSVLVSFFFQSSLEGSPLPLGDGFHLPGRPSDGEGRRAGRPLALALREWEGAPSPGGLSEAPEAP